MLTLLACLFAVVMLAIMTFLAFAAGVTLALELFPWVLYILLVIGVLVWFDRRGGGKK